jgi:DNA modification methylase
MRAYYYFKLDPNIRNPSEVNFGRMEIEGLLGQEIIAIQHFYDILKSPPASYFDNDTVRIQDYMLNLRTAYGKVQGYRYSGELMDLTKFIEKLAYTREIYAIVKMEENLSKIKAQIFPFGKEGVNFQVWTHSNENGYCLFRIITNMFFLEQLSNVFLCSAGKNIDRQTERVKENILRLKRHIMDNVREFVPKFPKDANWKEFEDFVDEPKEMTLYLTQYYGPPYKAKFHPRMIRSLLNYASENRQLITGDFMLGSGTLAIESVLLGLNTKGSDINPLTKIVVRAKIDALSFEPDQARSQIEKFFKELPKKIESEKVNLSPYIASFFENKTEIAQTSLWLNRHIRKTVDKNYQEFFLCALARVVSFCSKKRECSEVTKLLEIELFRMWKIIYGFKQMDFLHVPVGRAEIGTDDIKKLEFVKEDTVDLIITSPPYSTAIDYVKKDLAQLLLLELIDEPKQLDENMMGTFRKTPDLDMLAKHITSLQPLVLDNMNRFHKLPRDAQSYILDLKSDGNMKNALRCYKFLYNMWDAIDNMHRVLRKQGRCIIIIGNNVFNVKGEEREFRNGDFLEQIALQSEIGFHKWQKKIIREYSKSSYGTILKEDIIFLEK